MTYCRYCGKSLKEEAKFCPSCGQKKYEKDMDKEEGAPLVEEQPVAQRQDENLKKHQKGKKRIPKGLVPLMVGLLLFTFLLGGTYGFFQKRFAPETLIFKVEKALEEGDVSGMAHLMVRPQGTETLDLEAVEHLVTFLHENPALREEVLENLRAQGKEVDLPASLKETHGVLNLERGEKTHFFFHKYYLFPKTYTLMVESAFEEVAVEIQGKSHAPIQENGVFKEYGPFFAGDYEVSGSLLLDGFPLAHKATVRLYEEEQESIYLPMDVTYVTLTSAYPATLFVDGEETDIFFQGEITYGPVPQGKEVLFYGKTVLPWGEVMSPERSTLSGGTVELLYPLANEELKRIIVDTLVAFHTEWEEGLVTKDPYALTVGGSSLLPQLQEDMDDFGEAVYESQLLSLALSQEEFEILGPHEDFYYVHAVGNLTKNYRVKAPIIEEGETEPLVVEEVFGAETIYHYVLKHHVKTGGWMVQGVEDSFYSTVPDPLIHKFQ